MRLRPLNISLNRSLDAKRESTSMKLSARNIIQGTVTKISKGATTSIVHLDCNGTEITASITNEAVADLSLAEGQAAHAIIKASDVMVAVD